MTRSLLFVFAALLPACPDSHAPTLDAAAPDAAPLEDAPSPVDVPAPSECRLEAPTEPPLIVGEGCFCDGPVAVRGEVAYRLSFELEVVDIRDPARPSVIRSVSHEARYASALALVGDVLFASGGALVPFDVSDPSSPVSLGPIELDGEAMAMAQDGARLAVALARADGTYAVLPVDVGDPRAPVLGTPVELGRSSVGAIALAGQLAYAVLTDVDTGASVLGSLDLATGRVLQRLPRPMGSGSLPSIVVIGSEVLVSSIGLGIDRIDATDPASLRALGPVASDVPTVRSMTLAGDRLIVLGGGVSLFDVAVPGTFRSLGRADWPSDVGHAAIVGRHLIASGGNGLGVIPLVCD